MARTRADLAVILSKQGIGAIASKETTVRHAAVTTLLFQQARTAADFEADERLERLALVEDRVEAVPEPEPRRIATLARRARALVAWTT